MLNLEQLDWKWCVSHSARGHFNQGHAPLHQLQHARPAHTHVPVTHLISQLHWPHTYTIHVGIRVHTHTHAQFRGLTCPVGAAATSTTLHTSTNQHRNVVLLDDSCTHLLLCKQTIPATPSQVWARTVYVIAWALSTQCRHPPTFTVQSAGMLMNRSSSD